MKKKPRHRRKPRKQRDNRGNEANTGENQNNEQTRTDERTKKHKGELGTGGLGETKGTREDQRDRPRNQASHKIYDTENEEEPETEDERR